MACNNTRVWLGFEDELVTEKHKALVNFTTNKIGGKPDFPTSINVENPRCPLCQLPRPLILQIYAPLDNSTYHRTLYIFACINPNCWDLSESWACLRVQTLEQVKEQAEITPGPKSHSSVTDWCQDGDDWGEDNNANLNEENGNLINNADRISDEDDESFSFEESIRVGLENLAVDDRNANTGIIAEAQGGAVGRLHSPSATAEIEGDEGEVISIDTPTIPQRNIVALLQEVTPLPQELCQKTQSNISRASILQFVPYFINVWEESINPVSSDHHVRELLQEYQQNTQDSLMSCDVDTGGSAGGGGDTLEKYEKSIPAHGDKAFYHFLSRIQMNPGQILRYSRDGASPLLLYPLHEAPKTCEFCQGEMIFELQVLPTLISKLQLVSEVARGSRLEFGTILIFSCRKSCWSTDCDVRREIVVLQTEK